MTRYNFFSFISLALGVTLLLSGCAGNGYITSSINTVLGLDVSENPKTQVPHVRFGYVRSGLYYVPTGKTESTSGGTSTSSGQANETPTVVSDIFINSKFLTDITISEKFAIGGDAVQSQAAQHSFRKSAAEAVAGGGAVPAEPPTTIVQQVLPTRSEETRVTPDQIKKAVEAGIVASNLDNLRKPAAEAVKALRKAATSKSVPVDWAALLQAAGGVKPPDRPATAQDFFDFFNSKVTDQNQVDAIRTEANAQLSRIPQ
jgi:hypothetical protein